MTTYYLDSSIGMHLLAGARQSVVTWFEEVMSDERHQVVSSRLLQTEMIRTLRREGDDPTYAAELAATIDLVPISDSILQLAEMIEPHLKTLDAVHVASAIALREPGVVIATNDARMKKVAAQLGFATFDPVEAA